jgi:hypothetical protein
MVRGDSDELQSQGNGKELGEPLAHSGTDETENLPMAVGKTLFADDGSSTS